ncbi:hypothetical protein D3C81_375780 [compost metagenome]
MTTLCWDGKSLAADSRESIREMVLPTVCNKIHEPGPDEYWEVGGVKCLAFALAGMSSGVPYLTEMLRAGVTHRSKFPEDVEMVFNAIMVLEDHTAWVMTVVPSKGRTVTYAIPGNPPIATGSGENFAYSIMSIGKSAEAAVKHAMKLDPWTGGEVHVFTPPPKPEVPSKRPETSAPLGADNSFKLGDLNLDQLKAVIRSIVDPAEKPMSEELQEASRDAGPAKVKSKVYEAAKGKEVL